MQTLRLSPLRIGIRGIRQLSFAIAALLATFAISAYAQTDTGTIVGIVQDKSNARIASAAVDVTDMATGVTRSYVTNADGQYQAEQLISGVYSVTVKHAGFSTEVRQNVTVNVQDRVQVDVTMTVASEERQIVVSETAVQLQTQSAEVNGVMPSQEVNDLPLNGRDYDQAG